ncbi:arylsulfatase I-like [Watersipora subatra]|uniref:arylsulfatase I-like n=1 Tax=Watersipora subatra TaxID=2589382 RepID=UPI00355C8188
MNQCKLLLFGLLAVLILPASAGSFGQYGPTKRRRDRMDHWWRRNERRNCSSRPHIIFIMADDQGWNDVGFHNPLVDTPNINWLAENGIELTDYHTAPVCSASRAALLTSRYPSRTGIHQGVLLPRSKTCLPLELSTLPEMLKDNGYTTKMIGKWHLGSCNASCLPTSRGFDEFRGSIDATIGYFNWSQNGVMSRFVNDQPSTANLGTHLTIQHQRDAREMIMAHKDVDSPLFMFISPLAPHAPLEVTREMFDRHPFLDETDEQQRQRRESLGLVAALDDLVGETIQALRDAGLYDNSIVIFSSDNGGSSARLGHGSEDFW